MRVFDFEGLCFVVLNFQFSILLSFSPVYFIFVLFFGVDMLSFVYSDYL
jgi:hypothetical protein